MADASTALTLLLGRWAYHQFMATQLRSEIETQVLALGHSVETPDARAVWSEGRGSYDWEGLARALKLSKDEIHQHATVVVDWRAVCQAAGVPESLKARYYTPPEGPRVTLKLAP